MRRDKAQRSKTDKCQQEVIKSLRKIPGITVVTGHDDFLVGYQKNTFWYEWKSSGAISKKTGKPYPASIKESQKKLIESYTGHYRIVWSIEQILDDIGV